MVFVQTWWKIVCGNVEARFKDLLAYERVQASLKTFSPMSEFRRVKDLLADERVQAR